MTIDDAILHAEAVANRCDANDRDRACGREHRQLAEWLKEFKRHRWIPCTKGLPAVYVDVIVSSERGVQVMHMTTGGYWTDGAQLDAPGYVTAWMPLPEPYMEDSDA